MDFWLSFLVSLLFSHLWVVVDVGGDLALARNLSKYIKRQGETQFFSSLRSHLSQSDFSFCNLEGSIIPDKFVGSTATKHPRFDLSFSKENAEVLPATGFKGFGLANNHSLDTGEAGLEWTATVLKQLNLQPLKGWTEVSIKGIPFAILALNYASEVDRQNRDWTFSIPSVRHRRKILSEVAEKAKAMPVFVFFHGGEEDSDEISTTERNFFRDLIQAGADGVFGHHPHRMKTGGSVLQRPCYFSLGSVLFDRSEDPDCFGLLVRLHFWAGLFVNWTIDGVHIMPGNFRPVVWEKSKFLSVSPFREKFTRSSYSAMNPEFLSFLDFIGARQK